MMNLSAIFFVTLGLLSGVHLRHTYLTGSSGLINRPTLETSNIWNETSSVLVRKRRYLGLSKRYKLNKRYQECTGPDDVQGHCKHVAFCPMDVMGASRSSLDYLCVIEKSHVGVCCPDDILLAQIRGAQTVRDLPAGGTDYEKDDQNAVLHAFAAGCGLSTMARSIENPSPSQKWPWIAALLKIDQERPHFCGGALITDQHILTAAHCLVNLNINVIRVRLGEYDFQNPNETRYKDFKVKDMILHQEFEKATYNNDIAILVLEKPTMFNSYIWPICLPPFDVDFTNKTVRVAGWGQQYYAGPTSDVLLEVSMPVWEQDKCVDAFVQRISDNSLCAAGYEGDKDSCLGDSGGPLLYQLENDRWVTIGIVSWGIGCGNIGQPGIYTRVNKYIPWIVQRTIMK